jgi:hypothetical protein
MPSGPPIDAMCGRVHGIYGQEFDLAGLVHARAGVFPHRCHFPERYGVRVSFCFELCVARFLSPLRIYHAALRSAHVYS